MKKKNIHFTTKYLLGFFILLNSIPSWSQNKLDSLQYIDEVIITANPYKAIIPTQKLSGRKLKLLNSHSVADALRYFSGVQIKDYGGMGGLKTVNVRNMGSHYVGAFYDGIQIGNVQNGTVDLGRYSLDDLEAISLYNGQKSNIFQSAKDFASSSAIYLKSKKPIFKKGESTNLRFRYKTGSIQLINPSFRWEQRINSSFKFALSGEYAKSDGKYKFRYKRNHLDGTLAYDTTAIRKNSDIEYLRLETSLYKSFENAQWESKIYYYISDRGLPGAIVKNNFFSGERQTDRNFFIQSHFMKEFNSNYKFKIDGKYAYDYTHYLSREEMEFMDENVTKRMQFDNTYRQQDLYFSVVQLYNLSSLWDVSLSIDLQYNKLDGEQKGVKTPFSYPERYTIMTALASSINLGKFKAQGSLLSTYVAETVKNNISSPNKHEWSPTIVMGYHPFENHKLDIRGYFKHIFRMPTFNDLYYTQIGYSQLNPEQIDLFDIGFTYEKKINTKFFHSFSLQTDFYYSAIKNKIIASPTGSSFRWMMSNMGKVENKGIDVVAKLNANINKVQMSGNLCYSYSEAKDYTKINGAKLSSYGNQIPYSPYHSGSFTLSTFYNHWSFNYSFIYVGERYNGAVNNIARNHLEPWYTHDFSIQKTFKWNNYAFETSIEVNNILNQNYDVVLNYPMPGRNFKFIISLSL